MGARDGFQDEQVSRTIAETHQTRASPQEDAEARASCETAARGEQSEESRVR